MCTCDEFGLACQHSKGTQGQQKARRKYWARKRAEEQARKPDAGEPSMRCDRCGVVRVARYVHRTYVWPRYEQVCDVCKQADKRRAWEASHA